MPSTATTPSPAYPSPLPDAGSAATEWALDLTHGARKSDAWITTVININTRSEWKGDHYAVKADELSQRSDAGHYVAIGVFKPGSTQRIDENVEAVAVLVFDDVGDVEEPDTKIDIEWLRDKIEPTFIVETSRHNYQFSFVFDHPVGPDEYKALIDDLKKIPEAVGGIKDGTSLTRYVRLPSGKNPKAEKGGFKTRLVAGSGKKYSLEELQAAFGLQHKTTGAAGASKAKSAPIPEALALPEAEALALLDEIEPLIRNNGIGREDWIGIVYGFFNASGRNDDVEDIVDRFTAKREDGPVNPVDDFEHVWKTKDDAMKAGLTTIVRWLEKQGTPEATAMVHRIRQTQAKSPSVFPPLSGDNSGDNSPGPKPAAGAGTAAPVRRLRVGQLLSQPGFKHAKAKTILPGFDVGEVTLVGGPSGAMKSLWVQQSAIAIVAEKPSIVAETEIDYCGSVVFYANEDAPEQVTKRLAGIALHHKLPWPQKHEVHVWDGRLLTRNGADIKVNEVEVGALEGLDLIDGKIALIVVDTLAAALVSEETNLEFQQTMNLLKALAIKLKVAIAVVHHFRKGQPGGRTEEPTLESLRGGSTLTAAARNVLFIEPPSTKEAKSYRLDNDADKYMKLNPMKRSYGARGGRKWFERELVGIEVEDDRDGSEDEEDAPVLVPFYPNDGPQRMAEARDALAKLNTAVAAGITPIMRKRGAGKKDSVQTIIGLGNMDAKRVIDTLVNEKAVVLSKNLKTRNKIVVLRIVGEIAEEDQEDMEDDE